MHFKEKVNDNCQYKTHTACTTMLACYGRLLKVFGVVIAHCFPIAGWLLTWTSLYKSLVPKLYESVPPLKDILVHFIVFQVKIIHPQVA